MCSSALLYLYLGRWSEKYSIVVSMMVLTIRLVMPGRYRTCGCGHLLSHACVRQSRMVGCKLWGTSPDRIEIRCALVGK